MLTLDPREILFVYSRGPVGHHCLYGRAAQWGTQGITRRDCEGGMEVCMYLCMDVQGFMLMDTADRSISAVTA